MFPTADGALIKGHGRQDLATCRRHPLVVAGSKASIERVMGTLWHHRVSTLATLSLTGGSWPRRLFDRAPLRLLPGVIGQRAGVVEGKPSFSLLEHPQYNPAPD